MKQIIPIVFSLIMITTVTNAQSLGKERIEKLKKSVVRITTENGSGSGFFINSDGAIMTCWHVVASAIVRNQDNDIIEIKKIHVHLNDGTAYEAKIYPYYLHKGYKNAIVYDYCLIVPQGLPKEKFSWIKMGRFADVSDGDQIYSCGYPFGMNNVFISQGLLSTKTKDTIPLTFRNRNGVDTQLINRDIAILDLTLNHGNSGGPIIKIGNTPDNDEIVGIADFIITPVGKEIQELYDQAQIASQRGDIQLMGISQTQSISAISHTLLQMSVGISAMVSIDYYLSE